MLYIGSWLLGSKIKWNETIDISTDNRANTFATVLACNFKTDQARTNINIAFFRT